uniref:Uncharacterized protein n=1 Tax=Anguilla anguilla TaxID=7936 RepID=A0A0E9XHI4_ANGAN
MKLGGEKILIHTGLISHDCLGERQTISRYVEKEGKREMKV